MPSGAEHCSLLRVRGAHDSIKPGVQRAKRANPRIAIQEGFQPAERATDLECGGKRSASPFWIDPMIHSKRLSPAPRVLSVHVDRDPGAHAPGFMLSCATRTGMEHGELANYYRAHSACADMYRRLGRTAEARSSYEKALALTKQEPERQFLQERIRQLG